MNKSFSSNEMPLIGASRFFNKPPQYPFPGGVVPKSNPVVKVAVAAPAPKKANPFYIGQTVRGAILASNDSDLIRGNFRGKILEFGNYGNGKDVSIEDISTGKKYKFETRFLRAV